MRGILALALLLALPSAVSEAPTLTDMQRLTLQNRVLAYQLAQAQLESVVKDLTVPGYVINLSTLAYEKAPEKPEAK